MYIHDVNMHVQYVGSYSIVNMSSTSTGNGSVEDCVIDSSDCESPASDEADKLTDNGCDLQDLYESFDFEDEASRPQSSSQAQARGGTAHLETADRSFCLHQTALYAASTISTLQSF